MAENAESQDGSTHSSYLQNPTPYFPSNSSVDFPSKITNPSLELRKDWQLYEGEVRAAVGEMLVFGFKGTSVNAHARTLLSMGAGGVILSARNIEDPEQVAHLCANLKRAAGNRPLAIMVDQEGGLVQRLGPPFTVIPPARLVGNTGDTQAAAAIASIIGKELRAVNIDMDLAPVVDVDTNPQNPVIGKRSFGSSPSLVSEFGYAFIRGIQQEGIAACAKHYPGHGDSVCDSHVDLPCLPYALERLRNIELCPFAKSVEADVAAIMVGHLDVPCFSGPLEQNGRPASLSKGAIDHLRNALLFEGVVLTDCLEMGAIVKNFTVDEAAVQAVIAGIDMLLVSHTRERQIAVIDTLVREVLSGRIPYARIKEAGSRIAALKRTYVRSVPAAADMFEKSFEEGRLQLIGCKEHLDIVSNLLHQAAALHTGGQGHQ